MFAFVGDVGPVVNGAVFSGSGVNSLQHRCIVSLSHIFCYCLLKHLYNCSIFVIDLIYEIYYTIKDNNCLHIEMLQYGFR